MNNICIAVNTRLLAFKATGIQYYIRCLYAEISKDRNIELIALQPKGKDAFGTTINTAGFTNGKLGLLFDWFFILFAIRNKKINVLHGTSFILPLRKTRDVKYVVTIHDLYFLDNSKSHSIIFNYAYKFGIHKSISNADAIIAISENTKRDIIRHFSVKAAKITVIPLGVNPNYYKKENKKRLVNELYILSISTHPTRKNILSALVAFSHADNLSSHKYIIVGQFSKTEKKIIKQTISKLDITERVSLYGYASESDLNNLYSNAEFFVFPSFYEGFGLPVIEAMSLYCPVITSNNSALKELLPDKSWLIDPYSIDDIRIKMDKMATLSSQARKNLCDLNFRASKKYRWDSVAKDHINLYRSIINVR